MNIFLTDFFTMDIFTFPHANVETKKEEEKKETKKERKFTK